MSESGFQHVDPEWYQLKPTENKLMTLWKRYDFLLVVLVILAVDLFTPFLIWKGYVPGAVRWIADGLIAGLLALTIARMLSFDRIPMGMLIIIGATFVWSLVAYFEGQPIIATIWGWWRMFKYPTLGIFIMFQPEWPEKFSEKFVRLIVGVLTLELFFQLLQWLGGELPGDHLAGSFGRNGVAPLLFFIIVTLCVALGVWLATGKAKILIWVVVIGAISSGFGEMKVFPVALLSLAAIALSIHMIRGGRLQELILYVVLFSIIAPAFVTFYNVVVADARGTRRFEEYFEFETTNTYLNNVDFNSTTGQTYLGRGFALSFGWQLIQRDVTTLLFGYGLGARGESVSLGIVGQGLAEGDYGLATGTSLLVMMQELGLVGLGALALFMLWLVATLFHHVQRAPDDENVNLRYAVILFSIMWPFWLYYHKAWDFSVAMLLYWGLVGYLLSHAPERKRPSFQSGWTRDN